MTQEKKTILVMAGLIGIIAALYFGFATDGPSPVVITETRLRELKVSVIDWAKTNGSAPKTLAELELSADAITDHKGTPFDYQVKDGTVTITSFGADGKPGGAMFHADHSVEFETPTQ